MKSINYSVRFRAVATSMLIAAAAVVLGCSIDGPRPGGKTEGEPVSLSFTMSMDDLAAYIEGPATRSAGGVDEQVMNNITTDTIKSLSLALAKVEENPLDSRIVAFRTFARIKEGDPNNKRYFFYNSSGAHDSEGNPLENITLESVGGFYTGNLDDTQFDIPATYGANGFYEDGKKVKVTFNYNYPVHGALEKLTSGRYAVCIVANFSESSLLCYDFPVGSQVAQMISYWHRHESDANFNGIPPFPMADPIESDPDYVFPGFNQLLTSRVTLNDASVTYYYGGDYHSTPQIDALGFPFHDDTNDKIVSESYIRNKTEAILASFGEYIDVRPGVNKFDFNLKRDLSRISVTVNNQSSAPIKITELGFCEHSASAASFIFEPGGEEKFTHNQYPLFWQGAPLVSSPRAIVPFDSTLVYSDLGESHFVFDALTLPSLEDGAPIRMTIGAQVLGVTSAPVFVCTSVNADTTGFTTLNAQVNDDELWPVGTERYFGFQITKTDVDGKTPIVNQFFKGNPNPSVRPKGDSNVLTASDLRELAVDKEEYPHIWVLKKVKDGDASKVIIRNMMYHGWMKANGKSGSGDTIIYTDDESQASKFTISYYATTEKEAVGGDPETVAFTSQYGGTNIYFHVLNGGELVTLSQWNDKGSHYKLYEAFFDMVIPPMKKTKTFDMYYFDKANGISMPLNWIKRNTHININIGVRYNEATQVLDFSVMDWNNSINDVEFN